MNNPYGIAHFWQQGDGIAHSVAGLLFLMSIISWYVIFLKTGQLFRLHRQSTRVDEFWHTKQFHDGVSLLGGTRLDNPFRAIAEEGANAAAHHANNQEDLHGALNMSEWITICLRRSVENSHGTLQSGLSVLASIGSTAPFVGLLGTVWGIYHALVNIGMTGQASLDRIAGPVGESLIMTALGLAVAIPAVLGYNALVRYNKNVLARLYNFAHDLHAYLITGSRITAANLTMHAGNGGL